MRVIGISPYHDSSVAVINNNEIEYFFKEERLTRIKRDMWPVKSLEKVKSLINGSVDKVVIAAPSNQREDSITHFTLSQLLSKMFDCEVLDFSNNHHEQHAGLAFYNSGFEQALVFVIDRNGSFDQDNTMRECESVFIASYPANFNLVYKNTMAVNDATYVKTNDVVECRSSLGIVKVYETATSLIGLHPLENGKTMGLASYGREQSFPDYFADGFVIDNYFEHDKVFDNIDTAHNRKLKKYTTDQITQDNYQMYADYAYHVQKQTQEEVLRLVKEQVAKNNIKNVVITGGYGLNVVSNAYLRKQSPGINFFFEPIADDTGNSISVAMMLSRHATKDSDIKPIKDTFYHGIEYDTSSIDGRSTTIEELTQKLIDNNSVAVYKGKAEAGPRALGNRSILFNPMNKNAKDIVNVIKKREWYRPFAAMILEEHVSDYFITDKKISKFMTECLQVRQDKKEIIPGVIHVDDTCRIQTINRDDGLIYELLLSFYNRTGVPVLLNTSFNLAGEPLVETPEDALYTYSNSSLDCLWIANEMKLLEKNVDIRR